MDYGTTGLRDCGLRLRDSARQQLFWLCKLLKLESSLFTIEDLKPSSLLGFEAGREGCTTKTVYTFLRTF